MSDRRYKELFQPVPLENSERTPFRPADSLSNYVIEGMPNLLNEIRARRNQLVDQAEALAVNQLLRVNYLIEQGPTKENELLVTRLDVLMLKAAIVAEGGKPGPVLTELVERIVKATGRPATLTYEDVVINNPENDIRTFTNGLVGTSEESFYNGHRYIEEALEPSIQSLNDVLNRENSISTEEVIDVLRGVLESMRTNIAYTGIITKKMPVEHFKGTFRKYLGSLPDEGLRGPSGAFTARVPLIENLLMGETIAQEEIDEMAGLLQYFPLTHQQALTESLTNAQAGISIRQLLIRRGAPSEGMTILHQLSEIFRRFRQVHMKAVETHLSEVFEGKEKGTGGTEVDFLQKRLDRTHGFDNPTDSQEGTPPNNKQNQ